MRNLFERLSLSLMILFWAFGALAAEDSAIQTLSPENLAEKLIQVAIAIITPLILGLTKYLLPRAIEKIPGSLMPIIATIIGTIAGSLSGDPIGGAVSGLAGTGVHQVKKQIEKAAPEEPEEDTTTG